MFYTLKFINSSFSVLSSPKNLSCPHPHTSIYDLSAHHGDTEISEWIIWTGLGSEGSDLCEEKQWPEKRVALHARRI
ncbi:hypothetical protein F2Q68_00041908 [Brassica cretica]|uniref:Uncharacterized protein n=1 Tax=Brassica cretica TaxID=69181 RepID=A0A8S9MKB9_BRACR|nr:hypothetical protein F2Q68_00041908 [Brassica cretica]